MFRRLPLTRPSPPRFLFTAFSSRRPFSTTGRNLNANQSSSFKEGASRYKIFASPFAKVFLGAIFTYQVIYWTWLKLEMDESKYIKNQEVAALEKQARELTGAQK
ncbi:hypothetical protein F9C07_2237111 [Aspergillus flavus]|uniref:Uncharacterized protein n=3 Tax=Aspergillus subgen. Circumdati TaxID=2720871 RepID=A0A7U2MZY2_ASPFN|nr:uncharacterized protein G4B84_011630 [Aspergillus flavus NRRL3357]KAB8241605.1 hypothetical protein BDV35DRAFT_397536 [Aspergillus flavus]KAB8267736.1 hypothetical protein BDV30DRAFT_219479 [Aspergillus minisclerotigenes]KOC09938.1 hypothetical protein AFLA70_496g000401 [Aspergillus flavus AF70]KAF7629768.1 hypothetical protein AFLA_013475 [Aspergillus flavus NRRL3357]KAJ1706530.1 hypothetical protein NYO67_11308 [Aspergillus flavus]